MADATVTPTKVCTKCGQVWALDHFGRNVTRADGRAAHCLECSRAMDRERYAADPAKRKASTLRSQQRHIEAYRARHKRWRDANPDKVRALWERNYAKNKDSHLAKNKRWRDENPEKRRVCRRRRQALYSDAPGSHTAEEIVALKERQGGKCFYCLASDSLEADHFIPLSRGGSNDIDNIVMACLPCNRRKNAKLPWEWMPDRFHPPP